MAEITAAMVKELRERTQAGMMDCKKALQQADGNMAAAAEILAKSGKGKAEGKAGKIAAKGLVNALVSADGRHGVAVEVNCQTDFVAMGDEFKGLLAAVSKAALEHRPTDPTALAALTVDGKTLQEHANDLTARSGEKHAIRRVTHYEAAPEALLHTYIHHGSLIAVLVEVVSSKPADPRVREFADDVALQVASMNPRYLTRSEVAADVIAKQREVFSALMDKEDAEVFAEPENYMKRVAALVVERAQEEGREVADPEAEAKKLVETDEKFRASLEGFQKAAEKQRARKPEQREKILDGKVAKWLTEIVLLDQASVKESKKTIAQIQADLAKAISGTAIARFTRYEVGEGIETAPAKDFATEVAEMAAAASKA